MLPYFSGGRTPIQDPLARGAFFGLNLTHTRGDMYRALIEGIAFGADHVIETYAQAGQRPRRVLAVGGGTRNALWLQATSDVSAVSHPVYDRQYRLFRRLYDQTNGIAAELSPDGS